MEKNNYPSGKEVTFTNPKKPFCTVLENFAMAWKLLAIHSMKAAKFYC